MSADWSALERRRRHLVAWHYKRPESRPFARDQVVFVWPLHRYANNQQLSSWKHVHPVCIAAGRSDGTLSALFICAQRHHVS
jgi:hypothetical protein